MNKRIDNLYCPFTRAQEKIDCNYFLRRPSCFDSANNKESDSNYDSNKNKTSSPLKKSESHGDNPVSVVNDAIDDSDESEDDFSDIPMNTNRPIEEELYESDEETSEEENENN